MLWKHKHPVYIEEKPDAPNCEGRDGFRWVCTDKKNCPDLHGRGNWKQLRRRAELGADQHYDKKHQ